MVIQTERLYLFEANVQDPYFFGTQDGITTTLSDQDTISLLDIQKVVFFIDLIGKGGLAYSVDYGGEDVDIEESTGKTTNEYTLSFNLPVNSKRLINKMLGRQFCLLGMRRDLSNFVVFGQFECTGLNIDNEVQQRVTFKTGKTNARIFDVLSFNITEIEEVVDSETTAEDEGFDYTLELLMS